MMLLILPGSRLNAAFSSGAANVLRLERFDEGIAVAAEILLENFVNSFFDKMIGNLEVIFLKRLNDKLAIDQILKSRRADFLDLLDELLAVKLGAQQFLARRDQTAHLRVGNDVAVDDRRDAVDNFWFRRGVSGATYRRKIQQAGCDQGDENLPHHINFFVSSKTSPRCARFATKRGNLPSTSISSPRRVSINFRSRTSTRVMPVLAAASLISARRNRLSTAAGNFPNRSCHSRLMRSNCSRVLISAISR